MFLKHYTGLSDEKLLERFHTDWGMQLFCGTLLSYTERIRDNAFVSRTRSYLAAYLDLNKFQTTIINKWKEKDMHSVNMLMMDATCYESYIRFPTDVKLLWECCEWIWEKTIPDICKAFKEKIPRSKFKGQKKKQLSYSKLRRKAHRKTISRKRALLKLLIKGIDSLEALLNKTKGGNLSKKLTSCFATIKTIKEQQEYLFKNKVSKVPDRIVSLHKPYIRPIVRGKENKPVEFGVKVHMLQVDGINIIENASYNNFNECKRLKYSVLKHKIMFRACTHLSADRIYPTNENRRFITNLKIETNFDKKGPYKEDKEQKKMKAILNKGRSSLMEGSFGNEKNHYCLRKIKARSKETELVWLSMGVMTANAVKIAKRRKEENQKMAA